MDILFATGNENKVREVREILEGTGINVISMKEAGVDVEIVEDGNSFFENAVKKAAAVAEASGKPALADDSGLVVDALGGAPGIYSARFMGEDTPYSIKNAAIIEKLAGVPDEKRSARFVCAAALVFPDGRSEVCEETFEGRIAHESAGANGFGYDPIFYLPEKGCTSAELAPEEKNGMSHRGKAFRSMRARLECLKEAGEL